MLEEQEDKEEQNQSNDPDYEQYHAKDNKYSRTKAEIDWIDKITYQYCKDNKEPRDYNGDLRPQVRIRMKKILACWEQEDEKDKRIEETANEKKRKKEEKKRYQLFKQVISNTDHTNLLLDVAYEDSTVYVNQNNQKVKVTKKLRSQAKNQVKQYFPGEEDVTNKWQYSEAYNRDIMTITSAQFMPREEGHTQFYKIKRNNRQID